jgi:GntR family transcriptional regulator
LTNMARNVTGWVPGSAVLMTGRPSLRCVPRRTGSPRVGWPAPERLWRGRRRGLGSGCGRHRNPRRALVSVRVVRVIRLAGLRRVRHTRHTSYPTCSDTVSLVNHVDHMNPIPLYTQLADILRGMITSGELQPRSPLPSESYLQQEQGVSRGTVRTAVGILREEGLVVTIAGRGTFVRVPEPEGE